MGTKELNFRKFYFTYIIVNILFFTCFLFILITPNYERITYSFENSIIGVKGEEINFIDNDSSDGDCNATIFSINNNSNKVLQIKDYNDTGMVLISNNWPRKQINPIIEFDISKSDNLSVLQIYLHETGIGRIIWLQFNKDDLTTRQKGSEWKRIKTDFLIMDKIYNLKIVLNEQFNWFTLYLDGIEEGTFFYDIESEKGVNSLVFETTDIDSMFSASIDNIKYLWNPTPKIIIGLIVIVFELVFLLVSTLIIIIRHSKKKH